MSEPEIREAVESVIESKADSVEEYHTKREHGEDAGEVINFLVGCVLQKTGGRFDPTKIREEIEAELQQTTASVDYPVQVTISRRADEEALAERLASHLREDLDVPLSEDQTPDRFRVPETYTVYEISADGSVEVVEQGVY